MAADSHEGSGGGAEDEGKVVGTRSRHASCEEELPSHSSSSPTPSDADARRSSLPAVLPAQRDILTTSIPEYNPRPLDRVLPIRTFTPRFEPCYRSCPHRTPMYDGGPPCYVCSVLDVPPKYRRREAQGWQKLRKKLAQLSHGPLKAPEGGTPLRQNPPATVFTINERRPSDPPGTAHVEEVSAPPSTTPGHVGEQERDNLAFDAQDSVEGSGAREAPSGTAPQLPPATNSRTTEGVFFMPLASPLPSSAFGQVSPPPYSPTLVTNTFRPPHFPPQDVSETTPTSRCNRRMMCQLLYSLLLATASSTLIVSYEQPLLVITSVIVFMAMFVFLPIIAIIECLFRCKMEQDFRQYVQNILSTVAPSVHPVL